jgi:hypothetical protein
MGGDPGLPGRGRDMAGPGSRAPAIKSSAAGHPGRTDFLAWPPSVTTHQVALPAPHESLRGNAKHLFLDRPTLISWRWFIFAAGRECGPYVVRSAPHQRQPTRQGRGKLAGERDHLLARLADLGPSRGRVTVAACSGRYSWPAASRALAANVAVAAPTATRRVIPAGRRSPCSVRMSCLCGRSVLLRGHRGHPGPPRKGVRRRMLHFSRPPQAPDDCSAAQRRA